MGLTPYTYVFDHPPLGWIQLSALAWIPEAIWHSPGQLVVAYSRIIMLPFTVASCILVYVLARRMTLPRWAATLAVLLFGLSPLSVTLQREIFLDNIAVTWILAAFVLAYSPVSTCGRTSGQGSARRSRCSPRRPSCSRCRPWLSRYGRTWTSGQGSTPSSASPRVLPAHHPVPAVRDPQGRALVDRRKDIGDRRDHLPALPAGSGSILDKGPPASNAYSVLHNWLFYDPVLIVAGAVAVVAALAFRHLRPTAIAGVILVLAAIRPSGYLPAMYVIQMLPFFAIGVAGVADRLVHAILTYRARAVFWQQLTRLAVLLVCIMLAFVYVVPRWYSGDRTPTPRT